MSISAFYQCYKQPRAFEHCLQQFRKHYPYAVLWIVNDGGDTDLESIAQRYNSTYYKYESNISNETPNTIYNSKSKITSWLNRLRQFLEYTQSDFFILLEDDVFIMKPITVSTLQHDINGCNKGVRFPTLIETLIRSHNPNVPSPLYYGGCGGCVFRVDFFKRMFAQFDAIQLQIDTFESYSKDFATDLILSYLTWMNKGTIDMYPGFAEAWYTDIQERLATEDIEVLHQFKNLYEGMQTQ